VLYFPGYRFRKVWGSFFGCIKWYVVICCSVQRNTVKNDDVAELWRFITGHCFMHLSDIHTHMHTHPFNGPLSRTTRVSWYQKGKTYLGFYWSKKVSDSDISWAICKQSATPSRQITTPAPHHSVCTGPSCCPTNSVKALKALSDIQLYNNDNSNN